MNRQNILDDSPQYVKGVGPKRADLLKKIGVNTIQDLLFLIPRRYEDRSCFKRIRDIKVGLLETVQGEVVAVGDRSSAKGKNIVQVAVADSSGIVYATWFNQSYMKKFFKIKDRVILSGRVQWFNQLQISSPDFEIMTGDEQDRLHVGRVVPIYPLTDRLNQRSMRNLMKNVVDKYTDYLEETLTDSILSTNDLTGIHDAIRNVHFPEKFEDAKIARKRLVFEEFFLLELGVALKKQTVELEKRQRSYCSVQETKELFVNNLPFDLTAAQKRVINEIIEDLQSAHPMNRLLQGDVGSGKTVVAFLTLLLAVKSGYQAALMVPSEVLAAQHYKTVLKFFEPLGLSSCLLISDLKGKAKKAIIENIKSGDISIVVGTHALIDKGVHFKDLAMVVVDEQHRFGVMQRALLRQKGFSPDVLVMTATPIPRTLALTVYGDLDVSLMDEMPPGRGKISTHWIKHSRLSDAYNFIRKEAQKGHGTFIIYPLVEESEKLDLKAAEQMYEKLRNQVFPDLRLALVHGRMSAKEKNEALYKFSSREIDVLVATTVIEVGIDIQTATVILVENAERFGLSQLHQLRGRIGRSHRRSYCILEGNPRTAEGSMRLQAMVDTENGFVIAEKDLEIRGPGEFFGTKQHGLPEIRVGNIVTDSVILQQARDAAFQLLDDDPMLSREDTQAVLTVMKKRFANRIELFSVG